MELSFTIACNALLVLALLFYTGFGVTWLLALRVIRGQELLIAPFPGFAIIVTVGYWCGWMGWGATPVLGLTLLFSTVANLLALRHRRAMLPQLRQHWPVFAIACFMLVVALYPMWRSGSLSPIGTNGDQVLYVNMGTYLEKNTFPAPEPSGQRPAMAQLDLVSDYGFSLGLSYLHALIDILSGREAYETFSIVTAVTLTLSILGYVAGARILFGTGHFGNILTALFTAISPVLMGVHYDDFGMHVISLGLIPLTFVIAVTSLDEGHHLPLLAALLLSTAFTTYPPAAFVFALGPIVLYCAIRCVQQKGRVTSMLSTLVMLLGCAALFNLPGVLHAGKFFLHMLNLRWITQYGNVTDYIPWAEIYGISHHLLPIPLSLIIASLPLTLIALLFTISGLWRTKNGNRTAVFVIVAVYTAFVLWNRYGLDYPYGFYKALTFATFPALIGLASGFEAILKGRDVGAGRLVRGRGIGLALLALIVVINAANLMALAASAVPLNQEFSSLLALKDLKGLIPSGETIHIRDARDTSMLWMTYFLRDYDLSLAHDSPYYMGRDWPFYQEAITADLVLVDKSASLAAPWAENVVYENSRYQLLRKHASILSHVDYQAEEQALQQGDSIQMEIFSDHVVVGDRSFSLGQPIDRGEVLRLGLLAPAGAVVRFGPSEQAGTNRLGQDGEGLDWTMQAFPSRIILTNEGKRPVWLQGWLEIIRTELDTHRQRAELEMFERHQEEVIPASGFFEINGWYKLEDEKRRWTRETAFARFRNPHKPVSVEISGVTHGLAAGISPANVSIRLNGHILGEVNAPGAFRQSYFLSDALLGASAWGDLEITTSRTFNPKQLGLSDDARDLGVQVTGLKLHDFDLGSDGLIDIGTDGAKKYLGPGWSYDEQAEGFTFAWADAQESRLWVSIPQPSALELDMRVFALRYPSAPAQEVRVYVNDRHLQDLVLNDDQWRAFSLKLPASFLSPGINTFRFVYGYAVSPANVLPNNRDPRTLAVAFDFIRLRPQ